MFDINVYKDGCVYWYDSNGPATWFKDIFFKEYWSAAVTSGDFTGRPASGNWMVLK